MSSKFEVGPLKVGDRVALPMRRGVVEIIEKDSFALKLDGDNSVMVETIWVDMRDTWLQESMEVPEPKTLRDRIAHAINRSNAERGSNTPDFILAEYLESCLRAFDRAIQHRDRWYARNVTDDDIDEPAQQTLAEANQALGAKILEFARQGMTTVALDHPEIVRLMAHVREVGWRLYSGKPR